MSRISDLIQELCPDGVPFRALGEVGEFHRGSGIQKSDLTSEGIPAVHYGQIHTKYGLSMNETISFVDVASSRLKMAEPGSLLIATTSEDDESVGKATAWLGSGPVALSGDAMIFAHTLEPKFVSYFFASRYFQEQKARFLTGAKVRRISAFSLSRIQIPVPPIEVQREIVRILDQFTQLEAELERRRLQFEHYRDLLMTFTEGGALDNDG